MEIDDVTKTFLLFEATQISIIGIKDGFRHQVKQHFNSWFKEGRKVWKDLQFNMRNNNELQDSEEMYDELSAYVYDVVNVALSVDNQEEFLKKIKEIIK